MFDYYQHVHNLNQQEALAEIQKLNERLMCANPDSAIYAQLLHMLAHAQEAYQDHVYLARHKQAKDSAMDIGEIHGEVTHTDYSRDEVFNALVREYIHKPSDKKDRT